MSPPDPHTGLEHLWTELRRRNVVRVGLAYLAVAWLLIQLIGEIGPILELPDWLPRLVLGLLALGFVVALVLAWVYELTSEGLRTTAEVDADASLRRVDPRVLNYVVIGALSLALAYFVWESRFKEAATGAAGLESIAVLPFRDLSERADQQYFADGVAEELLGALSRVPGLRVAGRVSSFSIRDGEVDPQEAARRLGVTHLLEGSVRSAGDRLRVTAQLVNARDGFQLWSREFEGPMSDVFAVQDRITALVLEGLKLHLGDEGSAAPQVPATSSLAAYNDYLLARYHLARRTPDGIREAIGRFRTATQADPEYAPAWAGLAMSLVVSPYYIGVESAPQLLREIEASARCAIELDPVNVEAWSSLGTAQFIIARDWDAAAQSLGHAVELQPNDAGAANLYGDYLYNIGDYAGALEYETRAAGLEPLSAAYQHELAVVYEMLGRLDEAVALEQKAIGISGEFRNAWATLGRYWLRTGHLDELRALLGERATVVGEHFELVLRAGLARAQGDDEAARQRADELLAMARAQGLPLTMAARVYADLGDDQVAAGLVREAAAARDPILVSPLYFFLPEDWSALPLTRAALEASGLDALYDLRRANIAAGRGRGSGV